jgi:hypothetical protein
MGSRLPSDGDVLIIRPTGKKGYAHQRSNRIFPSLPGPCQEARHSKAGSEINAVPCGMQLLLRFRKRFPKAIL